MAVDIGQIVSSALGGAESSFARKEQRMGLAEQRRSNTRRELNNRAINSGLYTLDDTGNLHVDIKKAYESPESKAVLLDIFLDYSLTNFESISSTDIPSASAL